MKAMTFQQYIMNPMGIGSAVYGQAEMFRNIYTEKLNAIIVREAGKIDYMLYNDKDDYIIHMKVPSEVIENFYYDVLVRFYTDDPRARERRDLNSYYVQFFSNDPAFTYTHAYAMNKNNMLFETFKSKLNRKTLRDRPKVRNPQEVVGYVKSIFFCYLVMENESLFDKIKWEVYGKKFKKKEVLGFITHADDKIKERQELDEKRRKKEQRDKKKAARRTPTGSTPQNTSSTPPRSSGISSAKTVKSTRRSPNVKTTMRRK